MSLLVALFAVLLRKGFSSINTIGLSPARPLFGAPGYEIKLLCIAGLLALALVTPTTPSVDHWLTR